MTKYIVTASTLLAFALCLAPGQTPAAPRKIEILFLGHNSPHHDSAKFEPMLKDALASEPFRFTYTADPKDLNDANLAKYDELMIYANHTKIEPEQEKALLGSNRIINVDLSPIQIAGQRFGNVSGHDENPVSTSNVLLNSLYVLAKI